MAKNHTRGTCPQDHCQKKTSSVSSSLFMDFRLAQPLRPQASSTDPSIIKGTSVPKFAVESLPISTPDLPQTSLVFIDKPHAHADGVLQEVINNSQWSPTE